MPVIPALVVIGGAMGATGAAAAVVGGVVVAGTAAGVAAKGVSMYQSHQASKYSSKLATDTARYNQNTEEAKATQIEMDADANTVSARHDASIYTSRQAANYAASGVLMSGSPLAVQAVTAARIEQGILQDRQDAQQMAAQHRASGAMGVIYGGLEAAAIKTRDRANMISGSLDMIKTASSLYTSGVTSGMWGGGVHQTELAQKLG